MNKNIIWIIAVNVATVVYTSWGKLTHEIASWNTNKEVNISTALAVTGHKITVAGKAINYKATTGYMPIADKDNHPLANIFYVAYTAPRLAGEGERPLTFVFNGGPGSASIWLHMGSFGPVRVQFKNDKGDAPAPPYQYNDNPDTWLGFTDLVFIDPVSTGYSRAEKGVDAKQFNGYNEDIASVAEFIRLYIAQNKRWNSPKFLAGESYGTVRAVGLANYLQSNYKMYLNGITLISPALNYQLINFSHGHETPYIYYLPSYAVAAQYHNRLNPELQKLTPEQLIKKTSAFAKRTYAYFLSEGDAASAQLTAKVIDSLHYFTGLPKSYIRNANGRIADNNFYKELLRDENKVIGSFDSRFSGQDVNNTGSNASYDPSEANLSGLFVSAFNSYIRQDLNYENNLQYVAVNSPKGWNYAPVAVNRYLDVSETLKTAMMKNPNLKINVVCGYYDLSTPVGTAEYVVNHMGLDANLRSNISMNYYKAGHMVYISKAADAKFKTDGERFYKDALAVR
jgi:carboxypeptidase C (cathepsin A)